MNEWFPCAKDNNARDTKCAYATSAENDIFRRRKYCSETLGFAARCISCGRFGCDLASHNIFPDSKTSGELSGWGLHRGICADRTQSSALSTRPCAEEWHPQGCSKQRWRSKYSTKMESHHMLPAISETPRPHPPTVRHVPLAAGAVGVAQDPAPVPQIPDPRPANIWGSVTETKQASHPLHFD
jgi:hypothetical protein